MKYKEGERVMYKTEASSQSTSTGTIQKIITAGESLRPEPVASSKKSLLPRYVLQALIRRLVIFYFHFLDY